MAREVPDGQIDGVKVQRIASCLCGGRRTVHHSQHRNVTKICAETEQTKKGQMTAGGMARRSSSSNNNKWLSTGNEKKGKRIAGAADRAGRGKKFSVT